MILATLFTLMLGVANKLSPRMFRGTGGSGRGTAAMSEMWFPLAMMVTWGVGWGVFNKPLEATACVLFMAWGDCLTGWVRAFRYKTATKGIEGSGVMLVVSSLIAWAFMSPVWLGILSGLAATITEYICGDVSKVKFLRWADDNFFIPVIAGLVYFGGLYAIGKL